MSASPRAATLPLIVTSDPDLLDDLVRIAAAGGSEVEVASDPAAARARFATALLVVLGVDQAPACLRAALPRRRRVIVAGRSPMDPEAWRIAPELGAEHVAMLPEAEPWLIERFAERAGDGPRAGRVLAVLGGRGGAGASTLAGGLAVTAVKTQRRTLLLDADPLGGGLDLVLGWEGVDGLRWPALADAGPALEHSALLDCLPRRGDLVLLSFTRELFGSVPPEAMEVTLAAARRLRDFVVVDLPRHLDDAAALALALADEAILIVPAELRAAAAAAQVATIARAHCDAISVVVRGPAPNHLRAAEVARSLGLPLLDTLRPEPSLVAAMERGEAPTLQGHGPLAELCESIVSRLPEPAAAAAA